MVLRLGLYTSLTLGGFLKLVSSSTLFPAPTGVMVGQIIEMPENFNHDDYVRLYGGDQLRFLKNEYPELMKVMDASYSEADYSDPTYPTVLSGLPSGSRAATFSDDSTRFAIAQYTDGTVGANAGMVQVFRCDPDTPYLDPVLEQTIYNPTPQVAPLSGGYFGFSSELSGDGSRLIVSSIYDDADGTSAADNSGRCHVFVRSGTNWTLEQSFWPPSGQGGDRFGKEVSISADGVFIAIGNEDGSANEEFIQVYKRSGSAWSEYATIRGNYPDTNYSFSKSISISGNGDWLGTLDAATVYIYRNTGTGFELEASTTGNFETVCIADKPNPYHTGSSNPCPSLVAIKSGSVGVFYKTGDANLVYETVATTVYGYEVKITRDGKYIIFSETNKKIQIYRHDLNSTWTRVNGNSNSTGANYSAIYLGASRGYFTRPDNELVPFPVLTGCHTVSANGRDQIYRHRINSLYFPVRVSSNYATKTHYLKVK